MSAEQPTGEAQVIALGEAITKATAVVHSIQHRHGDELVGTSLVEQVDDAPSSEFSQTRVVVQCAECGTMIVVLTTVSHDLIGLESVKALARVAELAGAGHLPPDHRWENVARPDCPLCVALDAKVALAPGGS